MEQTFYVYKYLRKDGTPYYYGKGQGDRAFITRPRGYVQPPQDKSRVVFVVTGLTEVAAFELEKYFIKLHGRKDNGTGILRNRTDGGEGTSGCIYSEEVRLKISKAKLGKPLSKEHRQKLSEVNRGKPAPNRGVPLSEEARRKVSEARRKRIISKETGQRISESHRGKKWWVNEYGETRFSREAPGPEWKQGRKW